MAPPADTVRPPAVIVAPPPVTVRPPLDTVTAFANVVTPVMSAPPLDTGYCYVFPNMEVPSTSRLPLASISPSKVEMPDTLTLSNSV